MQMVGWRARRTQAFRGGGGPTISLVQGKLAACAAKDEPSRLRIQSVMRNTPPASSPSPFPSPSPSPPPPLLLTPELALRSSSFSSTTTLPGGFQHCPSPLAAPRKPRLAPEAPPPYSLSSQSRARATGGDALGEVRLARPLVGQAVAVPVAGERGLPTEDAWERPEVGEGLAKPAQSCCVARSAWPPVPPVGLAGVVQPVLPPGPRSQSSRPADKEARERPTLPRHLVPATFQQPVPATFWRRSSGCCNVARTSLEQVVGKSAQQWKIDIVPRAHRAHCVHYGPVGGGGASTTNGTILAPLWASGKNNDWGVLGFSPSHQQQRILAPLWAWGKNNDLGVLGFSPSHPQKRILARLWAWGKSNDLGVLAFSPSHQQQRILAPLWAWGKNNDLGVLGFSPSHQQQRILAHVWAWGKNNDWGVLGFSPSHQQQRILAPLWAWGKNNDLGVLGVSPSHQQQRTLAPLWAWGRNNDWGVLVFPFPSTFIKFLKSKERKGHRGERGEQGNTQDTQTQHTDSHCAQSAPKHTPEPKPKPRPKPKPAPEPTPNPQPKPKPKPTPKPKRTPRPKPKPKPEPPPKPKPAPEPKPAPKPDPICKPEYSWWPSEAPTSFASYLR